MGRTTVTAADAAELRLLIAAEPIYRRDGMTFWTPTEADGV